MHRNALVCVFLRTLGIKFLTTDRVKLIDDAIACRMDSKIKDPSAVKDNPMGRKRQNRIDKY
jgi:hypothetical protein